MTRKETLAAIRELGLAASYDAASREYRVAPSFTLAGGRGFQAQQREEQERAAYYTDDKADALDTARAMAARGQARL